MPNPISRRLVIKTAASAAFAAGLAGPTRAQALEPVTVMTPFGFIGDFIDLMNAYSGGHFKAQGLDAKVLGGRGSAQAIQQLTSGAAQYIRAAGIDTMRAVGSEQALPLIAISTLYQAGTFRMISPAEKPVKTAQELKGKTVGVVSVGGATEILLDLMLRKVGVSRDDVPRQVTGNSPGTLQLARQGRVDCFIASTEVVAALERAGEKIESWSTDKYVPMPGQCYVTTREELDHHSDRALRFLRAMRASVDELLTKPLPPIFERAAKDFDIPGIANVDHLVGSIEAARALWLAQGRNNLLRNVPALWEAGAAALNDAGLAKLPDPHALYTNAVIDKALAG
ncbi:MAG TPA: ABC transporter substrate-binding protein [Alphaproteobacteria bacterium]|nr:ABC transporter substrate-binding protein [Alphaproteobacteria bacterium]